MTQATFPRDGAYQGKDRLFAWLKFYGNDPSTGAAKTFLWSGHLLWDPASYQGGLKDARVMTFGYYERPLSGPRGDIQLGNATIQLSDHDRLLRGMLGNAYQYALVNGEAVVQAILESQWRESPPRTPVTLFRGLLNHYDPMPDFQFAVELKDWLGNRLDLPLPMVELTVALIPNLPADARGKYAPYVYGHLTDDASTYPPPTFVAEPTYGSYLDAGVSPVAGFGPIAGCLASPPSGVSATVESGGALSLDAPNPGEFGFLLASIDVNGVLSDPVPFYVNVNYGGTRGSFAGTAAPYATATAGNQKIRVDFTPGASAVATRIYIGQYYFGARWTYYIDVADIVEEEK